jgi:hypothetical protein
VPEPSQKIAVPLAWIRRRRYCTGMRALSVDVETPGSRPYFFWDEDVSVEELRAALQAESQADRRLRLLGKLLREARDIDVWNFVTPADVAAALPALGRRLGRRRRFWEFLIEGWRRDGLLGG